MMHFNTSSISLGFSVFGLDSHETIEIPFNVILVKYIWLMWMN